jgi:hypothetical protein
MTMKALQYMRGRTSSSWCIMNIWIGVKKHHVGEKSPHSSFETLVAVLILVVGVALLVVDFGSIVVGSSSCIT